MDDYNLDDLKGVPADQAAFNVYRQYLYAKKRWRYFSGRRKGKGKGKGKGGIGRKHFRPRYHLCDYAADNPYSPMADEDVPKELTYFKGKGKGHLNRSSFAPRIPGGARIPCRDCGGTDHWPGSIKCPKKGSGKGKGSMASPRCGQTSTWARVSIMFVF